MTNVARTFSNTLLPALMALSIVGCATLGREKDETPVPASATALIAQEERETAAATVPVWVGHGTLRMEQPQAPTLNWSMAVVPEGSTVTLRDPRAGKLWQYVFQPDGSGALAPGNSEKDLLAYLPEGTDIKAFSFWLRGLRHGPQDFLDMGEDGFPHQLISGDWTVDYTLWFPKDKYPLPKEIRIRNGDKQVDIVVRDWAWAQDDTGPDAGTIEL